MFSTPTISAIAVVVTVNWAPGNYIWCNHLVFLSVLC
jgi:hypothetical protein